MISETVARLFCAACCNLPEPGVTRVYHLSFTYLVDCYWQEVPHIMGLSGCLLSFVPALSFSWNYVLQIYIISSRFGGRVLSLVLSLTYQAPATRCPADRFGLVWHLYIYKYIYNLVCALLIVDTQDWDMM